MKREVISGVVVSALFVVIMILSQSGFTQSAISDCKQPFGNGPSGFIFSWYSVEFASNRDNVSRRVPVARTRINRIASLLSRMAR